MELFSDEGSTNKEKGVTELANRLSEAFINERRYHGDVVKKSFYPSIFEQAAKFCQKNNVKPEFLVHAIYWHNLGEKWTARTFIYGACERAWEAFLANKLSTHMSADVSDLESPYSIEIFMECETACKMIHAKYQTKGKCEKFMLGVSDSEFEIEAVTRLILSDMNAFILKQFGQQYMEWSSRSPLCKKVLVDFGFNHEQVEKVLKVKKK